jgi:hypothetical protein
VRWWGWLLVWIVISIPAAILIGKWLRRQGQRYPRFSPGGEIGTFAGIPVVENRWIERGNVVLFRNPSSSEPFGWAPSGWVIYVHDVQDLFKPPVHEKIKRAIADARAKGWLR